MRQQNPQQGPILSIFRIINDTTKFFKLVTYNLDELKELRYWGGRAKEQFGILQGAIAPCSKV